MAKGKDYKVGYKKPPKSGQFQPGQSGNKKGRPKGARNLKTELAEELRERIPIKEGGKQKKVSKQRAMIKALTAKAVQGDTKAATLIINMSYRLLSDQVDAPEVENLTAEDRRILKAFEQRLLKSPHKPKNKGK